MSQRFSGKTREIKLIDLEEAVPRIVGHYSHVVELPNGMVFVSGQKAWNANGSLVEGDVVRQTEVIFDNIVAILSQIGLEMTDVARISCHLSNISNYDAFNRVYTKKLGQHRPARTVLGGYQLRDGALVELVVEAYRGR